MKTKDIGLLVSYEENNYSKYCIEKKRKRCANKQCCGAGVRLWSAPGSGRICVKFVYASKQACSAGTVLAILFSLDWPNNGKKKTLNQVLFNVESVL